MKKYIFICLALIFSLATGIKITSAVPSSITYSYGNGATSAATTSPFVMTPGTGTTTITAVTDDMDDLALYLALNASTTATAIQWQYQYSNGTNCLTSTACDWYNQDLYGSTIGATQNVIAHSTTTITHTWTPGNATASTTYKATAAPYLPGKFTRVIITMPAGSTNGMLTPVLVKKQLPRSRN